MMAASDSHPDTGPILATVWPGTPYPLGATYDGAGTNFALFSEVAERVELCLIDDGRHREPGSAGRGRRLRLARLPAGGRPGPALRLPRARAVRPGDGPALQPEQAAARPLRQGHRRRGRDGPGAVLLRPGRGRARRLGVGQRTDDEFARPHDDQRGDQPVLRLGATARRGARTTRRSSTRRTSRA